MSTVDQAFGECAKYFPCAAVSVYASSSASINFFVALYYSDTMAIGYAMDAYGSSLPLDPDADVSRWKGTGLPDRKAGLECADDNYEVDVVWFYRTWAYQFTDAFVGECLSLSMHLTVYASHCAVPFTVHRVSGRCLQRRRPPPRRIRGRHLGQRRPHQRVLPDRRTPVSAVAQRDVPPDTRRPRPVRAPGSHQDGRASKLSEPDRRPECVCAITPHPRRKVPYIPGRATKCGDWNGGARRRLHL